MSQGHVWMFCALLSFSALGVFHKLADVKKCRPNAITALLYFWSLVLVSGIMLIGQRTTPAAPLEVAVIGIPFGISAAVAILAFQAGIRHGNISTSWLAINLSSGVPTVASILIYSEAVTPLKAFALLLIPVAMMLLWRDKVKSTKSLQ
jgi:EamA domain-containing membrane protein RarD